MKKTYIHVARRWPSRGSVLGIALAMLVTVSVQAARAQALDQVPSDAMVVVKFRNIQATSTKLAKYFNDLGLAAMVPALNDPLKALEGQMKVSQGINADGDIYLAIMNPWGTDAAAAPAATPNRSMVILFPVSDYKAFLANFPDAQTDGDVTQVKMANSPDPGFIANWGTYAAISPMKDLVSKKPDAGLKITAAGDKELSAKDVTLYANFPVIRAFLQPKLAENREQIISKAEDAVKKSPNGEKMAPFVHAAVNELLNIADGLLHDCDAATFGINIGDQGLTTTLMGDFSPGSYSGSMLASVKNTTDPLLAGLPSGKYLFFGGYVLDPTMASKLFADVVDPVAKEITAAGPDMQPINDYVAAMKTGVAALKGSSIGVIAPTGALGQEALLQEVAVLNGDAQTLNATIQKAVSLSPDLFKAVGVGQTYKITATPNAKTLDGVSFDSVTTTMTPDPANPMAQQQAQMMALMYGPGGATQFTGVAGDHLIFATGVSDAVLSTLIASAKSGEAPLDALDAVKKVATNLPTNRAAEVFIPLDQVVATALSYAKQFGFAMPVQLPPDVPPIGETISTDASTVKVDAFVPTPLVQSLVAAGMQAYMQMNGGGGGGGM